MGAPGGQGQAGRAHGDAEEHRPSWNLAQDGPLLETSQTSSTTCKQRPRAQLRPLTTAEVSRAAAAAPGGGEDTQGALEAQAGQEAEPHHVAAARHGVEDGGRLQGRLGAQLEDLLQEHQGRAVQAEAVGGRQVEDTGQVGAPADAEAERPAHGTGAHRPAEGHQHREGQDHLHGQGPPTPCPV